MSLLYFLILIPILLFILCYYFTPTEPYCNDKFFYKWGMNPDEFPEDVKWPYI